MNRIQVGYTLLKRVFLHNKIKKFAPGEARTHGLQIMRLTRCLLRYGGFVTAEENIGFQESISIPTRILDVRPDSKC